MMECGRDSCMAGNVEVELTMDEGVSEMTNWSLNRSESNR